MHLNSRNGPFYKGIPPSLIRKRCRKQDRKETNVLKKHRNSDKVYKHHITIFFQKEKNITFMPPGINVKKTTV